jgi:hypothetical protein
MLGRGGFVLCFLQTMCGAADELMKQHTGSCMFATPGYLEPWLPSSFRPPFTSSAALLPVPGCPANVLTGNGAASSLLRAPNSPHARGAPSSLFGPGLILTPKVS